MPEISAEEFDKRYGPLGTSLSFGAKMPLRSVPIFGHDMTKPFEERFHDVEEPASPSTNQELEEQDLAACRRMFEKMEQAIADLPPSPRKTHDSKPESATDKHEKDPS